MIVDRVFWDNDRYDLHTIGGSNIPPLVERLIIQEAIGRTHQTYSPSSDPEHELEAA